jgi:hypothetical protein
VPSIFVRDELRAAIEAATGGLCTVHYTQTGQPSYFRWIPKFNLQDIGADYGTGVHPAFVVDGVVRDGLWIGMYPGIVKNGELLSLPGVDPTPDQTVTYYVNAARACGAGFHAMSNAEWAAVALLTAKSGPQPRGNTNWGRAHDALWETARRVDGGTPGSISGTGRTLTGTGPLTWRHDGSPAGISDLVGNVFHYTPGMRLVDGEIQVLADNNAATASDFTDAAPWKAISLSDGSLVAPGTAGTAKYDSLVAYSDNSAVDSLGVFQIDDVVDFRTGPAGSDSGNYDLCQVAFNSLAADTGITVPPVMKALLLAPGSVALNGVAQMRNHGKRTMMRGGNFGGGTGNGLGGLYLLNSFSDGSGRPGARPAKV